MRRNERKITDEKVLNKILLSSNICSVALFDDKYPYVIPMNYGYKDNTLYFHGAFTGKKINLIKKNKKVGFEIHKVHEIIKNDVSCKWTTKYSSITGFGEIDFILESEEKRKGLDIIMQHHGKQENEYSDRHIKNVLILKLKIESMTAKQSEI